MKTYICMLPTLGFQLSSYCKGSCLRRQLCDLGLDFDEFLPFHHCCLVHQCYLLLIFFYFALFTWLYFVFLIYSSSVGIQTLLILLSVKFINAGLSNLFLFLYFLALILRKNVFTIFYSCLFLSIYTKRELFILDSSCSCCLFSSLWACMFFRVF